MKIYFVPDTAFNQTNSKELIGLFFLNPPSYTEIRAIDEEKVDKLSIWENYSEFRNKVLNMGGADIPEKKELKIGDRVEIGKDVSPLIKRGDRGVIIEMIDEGSLFWVVFYGINRPVFVRKNEIKEVVNFGQV